MIRNPYDHIPHPAQDIQQEKNTNAKAGIKYNALQAEC